MSDGDLKHLEQSNPIIQVATEMGLKIRGNMGQCFRHDRHTDTDAPTLFFDVVRNRFFCKVCPDVGGGVIDFICQYRQWDRQKAIDWLCHRVAFDRETQEKYYHKVPESSRNR